MSLNNKNINPQGRQQQVLLYTCKWAESRTVNWHTKKDYKENKKIKQNKLGPKTYKETNQERAVCKLTIYKTSCQFSWGFIVQKWE